MITYKNNNTDLMFLRAIPLENVENSKIFRFKRLYLQLLTTLF